jgi:hypothetical protein
VAEAKNGSCYEPARLASTWHSASANEARIDELAAYYALPSLSIRRAFGRDALRAHADPFFRPQELTEDGLHPKKLGCRGPHWCRSER